MNEGKKVARTIEQETRKQEKELDSIMDTTSNIKKQKKE